MKERYKRGNNMISQHSRGVTLIMVAAVLAILAALATGFYTTMLMQTRAATRYADSIRAEMMSRAGIEYAIGKVRDQTFTNTEDPTAEWYMWDFLHGARRRISFPADLSKNGIDDDGDGVADNLSTATQPGEDRMSFSAALSNSAGLNSDRFTLNVHDAASRINVNACDNLGVVLDNLCRVIGPPLIAADQNMLIPRVWEWYGGNSYNKDSNDWPSGGTKGAQYGSVPLDIYYQMFDKNNALIPLYNGKDVNPETTGHTPRKSQSPYKGFIGASADDTAVFGDGYAIAAYRARRGKFKNLEEIKQALTYVERNGNDLPDDPLEQLEIEVKFAAIRDYVTINSWVDTTTVCTGKFEWVPGPKSSGDPWVLAVDRDKSWIPDDPVNDPENFRGSLRGCYVSIINGHGAGQVRRIRTNGIDWIEIEAFTDANGNKIGWLIPPGPTSSYMIYAAEDAKLVDVTGASVPYSYVGTANNPPKYPPNPLPAGVPGYFPSTKTDPSGAQYFEDSPGIDYSAKPLCIHRAPVNINTASDKVLAALFMGINVTHGHFLSIGTDVDMGLLAQFDPVQNKYKSRYNWNSTDPDWIVGDYDDPSRVYRTVEPYILTPKGLKRIPGSPGKLVYDVDYDAKIKAKTPAGYDFAYINNYGSADPAGTTKINEAMELAFRIIVARTREPDPSNKGAFINDYIDPLTGMMKATGGEAYHRGPFTSWDDLYFRAIKPWDDARVNNSITGGVQHKASVARLIMAHFNPNTDMLKFNPNIEWIDRWGRNFTQMEPVMVYSNQPETVVGGSLGHGALDSRSAGPNDIKVCDQDGFMNPDAVPVFCRERIQWAPGSDRFFVNGPFGIAPKWQGTYITRSFRYKSDEMIDKTDLNRSTTEFSFASRGIFEIQSVGQVMKRGEVLAERKVQALVKVYDVWTESTQQQFVNGYMTRATGPTGTPQSGTVARDYKNVDSRLALNTLPEALVPLKYTIKDPTTGQTNSNNAEIVDTTLGGTDKKRNAWSQPVDINLPLIVANKVLPAAWDGQIVLATNTLRYEAEKDDPKGDCDTFLASFTGDLDTATCQGNGHEQAKTPLDCKVQVLDAFSVLGALNDNQFDADPGLAGTPSQMTAVTPDLPPYTQSPLEIYRFKTTLNALRGLDPSFYWNNCTCRQGDLRPDGLYVAGPGVSGNDGVMKYLCGVANGSPADDPSNYDRQNFSLNGKGATRAVGEDFNNRGTPGQINGWLISMWTKTQWPHNDNRTHEFFDCTTPGYNDGGIRAEAFWIRKQGGAQYAVSEWQNGGGGVVTDTNSLSPQDDPTWGVSGGGNRVNDLCLIAEYEQDGGDWSDPDWCLVLHGGTSGVPVSRLDPNNPPNNPQYKPESPAYRVQPFRWHFLGARVFLQPSFASANNPDGSTQSTLMNGAGKSGFWRQRQTSSGFDDQDARWVSQNIERPFIDSERWSDGINYDHKGKYWTVQQIQGATGFNAYQNKGRTGAVAGRGNGGQPVRWSWASPGNTATADGKTIYDNPSFGVNNCNAGMGYPPGAGNFTSIYRSVPEDGTYAVIDEYKISRKEVSLKTGFRWSASANSEDRITRNDGSKPGEMTLSRYYLPADPSSRVNCPQFTSQTMLQSLKGFDKKTSPTPEYVTLARVSWSVFTPRFMHENKTWDKAGPKFKRNEVVTQNGPNSNNPTTMSIPFRGPFDYCVYNDLKDEIYEDYADPKYDNDMTVVPYRCNRPTPSQYQTIAEYKTDKSYHSSLGVEVAVLQDEDSSEVPDDNNEKIVGNGGKPFTNPDALNQILDAGGNPIRVRSDRLRYRVWFRYPADQLADPGSPKDDRMHSCVNPGPNGPLQGQYLLDTPIFDDISITYFTKPRILDYREVTE